MGSVNGLILRWWCYEYEKICREEDVGDEYEQLVEVMMFQLSKYSVAAGNV